MCNDPRGDSDFDLEILLDVPDAEIDRNTHCRRHCTADNALEVPESLADSQTHPVACAEINVARLLIPSVTHCEDDVVAAAAAAASHLSFSSGESNSLLAIDCDSLDLLSTTNPGSVSPDADAASGVCDGP